MSDHAPSALQAHLGFWLRAVSNHVSEAFARKLAVHDTSVAEWVVLRLLLEHTTRAPSRLAEELGLTRGAMTRLIDRLIERDLVVRRGAEGDRRYQAVYLTPAGQALVPVLAALADQNDAEFFGHLTPDEHATLEGLLRSLVRDRGLDRLPVD